MIRMGVSECFFWYWPTRLVPDKRPFNGCVCMYSFPFHLFVPIYSSFSSGLSAACESSLTFKRILEDFHSDTGAQIKFVFLKVGC